MSLMCQVASTLTLAAILVSPLAVAAAADLPNAPGAYPALGAGAADQSAADPWAGLYAGAGVSAWGGKGVKGGFGGEGYIGYDHAFDNGVILGVRGETGYAPFAWATPRGFTTFTGTSFAGGEAVISYPMGQVTPYLIAGVDLARPTGGFAGGSLNPLDNLNNVFSGPGAVQAVGTVGMGVTYQVTPNLSFGVEARVHTVNNGGPSGWPY
jgi:opacity protein-like surface antigen